MHSYPPFLPPCLPPSLPSFSARRGRSTSTTNTEDGSNDLSEESSTLTSRPRSDDGGHDDGGHDDGGHDDGGHGLLTLDMSENDFDSTAMEGMSRFVGTPAVASSLLVLKLDRCVDAVCSAVKQCAVQRSSVTRWRNALCSIQY
jgi:hypothetical protein